MGADMKDRIPAEAFPPGDFLEEELEERGWSQKDLAAILGRPPRVVNEIIAGKRSITPETAAGLADALGTSAQFWLNLESSYQLWKLRSETSTSTVSRRAKLYSLAPVRDLCRRGWIEDSSNVAVLEKGVMKLLDIKSTDEEPAFWPHAARKSTSYSAVTPAQQAWLFRARRLAATLDVAPYSPSALEGAAVELRELFVSQSELRHVPRVLAHAGIRFLIVEHLPKTKIDGACFWLDKESPVVVLSLRYDRIDYFWHTLGHELGHAAHGHGMKEQAVDNELMAAVNSTEEKKPAIERQADDFAASLLLDENEVQDFIDRVGPLYSKAQIEGFARRLRVHPGIVVGRLQHLGEISFAHSRASLEKVRDIVTQSTLTDGWGHTPPADI